VARRANARVIDVNPGESAFSSIIDVQIRGKSGKSLPRVVEAIKRKLS
jgi:NAD-dependent SIR2 family protein deacetylase